MRCLFSYQNGRATSMLAKIKNTAARILPIFLTPVLLYFYYKYAYLLKLDFSNIVSSIIWGAATAIFAFIAVCNLKFKKLSSVLLADILLCILFYPLCRLLITILRILFVLCLLFIFNSGL